MPVVDYAALPEFPMRAGITGKWITSHEHGATTTSVLSNTVEPGVAVPKHFHEYEEIVLVEEGRIWVELGDTRVFAAPGQAVIIPPRTPHAWGTEGPGMARVLFVWPVLEPFAPGKSTYFEGAPPKVS
ncbi:MAG: cupin domain-containing protein [Reyranella sp.]|uniref:cupin domain-containing protein n=1 Tax=Reyranella sp. TaxID=1929291 RepID=UPI00120A77AE|nr:cupin domain-containing protein [Reyranella sp.]TAJ37589.1 MAG: cupin domain-containing protein [Reyranella sp.]